MSRRPLQGFTLSELMVAYFLIGVAVLTVLGLAISAIRSQEKAADIAGAALVARTELERAIELYRTDATFFAGDYSIVPLTSGLTGVGDTAFTYKIYAATVADPSGAEVGIVPGVEENNHLKKVDVYVWWMGSDRSARQGYGTLRTEASQLVKELYAP